MPDCATLREENWSRSNSFWVMYLSRRRNATSAASSESRPRSMTESGSNLLLEWRAVRWNTKALKLEANEWITTRTKSTR